MTRHPKNSDLPLCGIPKAALGHVERSIAAELRAVALAIRLFGLAALPTAMKKDDAK
jgi:hypothetical protein